MDIEKLKKQIRDANQNSLDMSLEIIEEMHVEIGRLESQVEELETENHSLSENPFNSLLAHHNRNIRVGSALQLLFQNFDQIGVETLEKFIENQLNHIQA